VLIARRREDREAFCGDRPIANLFEFAPGGARRYSMIVTIGAPSSLYSLSQCGVAGRFALYPMTNRNSRKNVFLHR
jgi:hypothetical protein